MLVPQNHPGFLGQLHSGLQDILYFSTKDVRVLCDNLRLFQMHSLRFVVILADAIGGSEYILQNRLYQILQVRATFISDLTLISERK